jgi:outer membrane protein assembly complex protein YaeT
MTTSTPFSAPTHARPATWCALTLFLLCASIGLASTEAPPIATIRVESPSQIDETSIAEVLELEVGQPLDLRRLREVILVLYAGGQVEWLRVESAESPDGLDVVVHISYQSTVSQIKVGTKKPMLRVKIQRWLKIKVGDPVTIASIETNRRRVERRLHDRGYADAVVEAYLEYNRKANTVTVEYDVVAGPPQVVGSVVIDGLEDAEEAAAAMPKFKEGARLTTRLEERLRTRTEASLRTMGYWEAEVLGIERQAEGAEVDLLIRVETGLRYRLELEAPEASLKIAENAFPDPAEEELHPAQTEALVERVQERLQEVGYLMAEVSAELVFAADEQVLHLRVDPGSKLKVAAVEFPGADLMSIRQLENAVLVRPGKVGGRFNQQISNATLKADRLAIEELYHREGFPDVAVMTPEMVSAENEGAVRVVFTINEGARWSIVEFRLEGLPVETAAELEANPLGVVEGTPWSPAAVERADRRVEEALADTGYPDGQAEVEVDTSVAGKAVVIMRVEPGPFVRIGNVVIAGLRHTREKLVSGVIRRAGVRPGEPLSRRRMLDAQRGLYELGLFRRVELVPMPGQEHRVERNIVVRCEEGEQKSYLFGVGYSNVDAARLILGWSHLNLFGGAHAFSAEVSLSQSQQRYSLSWREKRTLGLDIPSYLAIYRTDERIADRDLLRRGLWIDFGDRLKRPLRPWFRYEYEVIQPESLPPDVPVTDIDFPEETKVASITPSIEWDTRDNPLAPRKGVFASASLQYAFPAFQADEHFLKMQTGATLYRPIWRGFGAVGLRLGAIRPFDQVEDKPENRQIPFAYRFFAGGRTTHRAFDTDRLGIPGQTIDNGQPIGGNALILLNVEYQRRIEGPFFAVIFIDAGNVWQSPSHVRFGDIRWGAGLGLHYLTPAGPLRAEYGWKLDREEGEPGGKFFVSFGVPF